MTTKSIDWKYEKEYRIIVKNHGGKPLEINSEFYKEIIFGLKMDVDIRMKIKEICKKKFPCIKFYQAKSNDKKFKIDIVPIK